MPKGRGALVVNPYYADAVADALHEALKMGRNRKHIIHERLHQYVSQYTSQLWGERLMKGLVETSRDVRDRKLAMGLSNEGPLYAHHRHPFSHSVSCSGGIVGLDLAALRNFYERSTRRLLVRQSNLKNIIDIIITYTKNNS